MTIGYEPIVWNDTLMTGVPIIDEQHQILVNMINELNIRLTDKISPDDLQEIVHDLMSYALYHFDTEEELMLENAYGTEDREAHFHQHRDFSAKVAALQQGLKQGQSVSREELLTFLNGWLVNHILKTDMRLGKFLTIES